MSPPTPPRRLPRPGQVTELCRLCGSPLVISVENPQRVCAQCGEVNLPTDGGVALGPPPRRPPAPPPGPSLRGALGLGLLHGVLAAGVGIFLEWRSPHGGGLHLEPIDAAFNALFVFVPALPFSLGAALVLVGVRGGRPLGALGRWVLGLLGGIAIGLLLLVAWAFVEPLLPRHR